MTISWKNQLLIIIIIKINAFNLKVSKIHSNSFSGTKVFSQLLNSDK
jgi:hypothetical protein